jgi:hypothetical protein
MINSSARESDQTGAVISFASQNIQATSKVYSNLGQEIIITTEDKIRLCLIEHLSRVEKKGAWMTPLGIFLTIAIVIPTTTFHDFLLSAETWQAVFVLGGSVSLIWLVQAVWKARTSVSLADVLGRIKSTGVAQSVGQTSTQRDGTSGPTA